MARPVQDPNFTPFELKAGPGQGWGGIHTQNGTECAPPFTFSQLVNWRFKGGRLKSVPGVSNAVTLDGITFKKIWSNNPPPVKLWVSETGCISPSDSGGTINNFDPEQEPAFQGFTRYTDSSDFTIVPGVFDGHIYFGVKGNLRRVTQGSAFFASSFNQPPDQTELVATFPGFTISCMQAFDGKLFIGLNAGAGTSKISTFDGVTIKDDTSNNKQIPIAMTTYRELLVVGYSSGADAFETRTTGASPGTYTASPAVDPGGIVLQGNNMVSYQDKLYFISSTNNNIYVFDGTANTVAVAHAVTNAGTNTGKAAVTGLAVLNHQLYYAWNHTDNLHTAVGRFDGTASAINYIDTYKDITAQLSGIQGSRSLSAYKNALYLGGYLDSVIHSAGLDITGTWVGVNGSASVNRPVVYMTEF